MDQSLSSYKTFYTVASTGNISKAAKELYISQPAISKSIRRLEDSLGVVLFNRSSRGVTLTDEGQLLYQHVRSAFDTLSDAEDQLKLAGTLGIGQLRIGVSTTLCKYVLLPYLQQFILLYPHIKISITCQSTNQTLRLLEENRIDVGLIGKPDNIKPLHFYPIGEIEDIFVATASYMDNLKLRSGRFGPNMLETATFMLLDKENMTRQYIDDYLLENKIQVHNLLEVTTLDLLIEFAKIGLGIACVIKEFVHPELAAKKLIQIPLGIPIHKREIGFAYLKNRHCSQSMEHFIHYYESPDSSCFSISE
ncbi:LysR family transcriptional regulator [Diplocloster modestus]|uniref:LysR family transcriptional regulator n=1 Tax=Diplocloster modestus TaxID=2850322 RepID=A0ABS6K975_9FIRM|nr:LysR family transcriptional regulator [Diplocloster modestus]MBU9727068.1 LysR family transcriptional regulator [Diplocloster modestus]